MKLKNLTSFKTNDHFSYIWGNNPTSKLSISI